jgi:Icc-related predicted phosphoesterase
MKVSIASDLHLEFNKDLRLENTDEADVLILAGDILVGKVIDRYDDFLADVAAKFPKVLAIAGNHESYSGQLHKTPGILREAYGKHGITFLDDETIVHNGVAFFGGTLWTDMNKRCPLTAHTVQFFLNDYRAITYKDGQVYRKLLPKDTLKAHSYTLEGIRKAAKAHERLFVITHHAPSTLSVHPRYADKYYENAGFVSDLSAFVSEFTNITHWVHGHIHDPVDYMFFETRVIANPHGYPDETYGPGYPFRLKTVEVE